MQPELGKFDRHPTTILTLMHFHFSSFDNHPIEILVFCLSNRNIHFRKCYFHLTTFLQNFTQFRNCIITSKPAKWTSKKARVSPFSTLAAGIYIVVPYNVVLAKVATSLHLDECKAAYLGSPNGELHQMGYRLTGFLQAFGHHRLKSLCSPFNDNPMLRAVVVGLQQENGCTRLYNDAFHLEPWTECYAFVPAQGR